MKKIAAKVMMVGLLSIALMITGRADAAEKLIDDYPIATTLEVIDAISDDGSATLRVAPGAYFMVALYAAGGTGYNWAVGCEKLILTEVVATATGAVSSEPLAGGPNRWRFCLRVNPEASGQETIRFNLSRSWLKNEKPAKTFDLTIVTK